MQEGRHELSMWWIVEMRMAMLAVGATWPIAWMLQMDSTKACMMQGTPLKGKRLGVLNGQHVIIPLSLSLSLSLSLHTPNNKSAPTCIMLNLGCVCAMGDSTREENYFDFLWDPLCRCLVQHIFLAESGEMSFFSSRRILISGMEDFFLSCGWLMLLGPGSTWVLGWWDMVVTN